MVKRTKMVTKGVEGIPEHLQRMAISYILDKGYAAVTKITEEEIDSAYQKLLENEKNGTNYIITLELQRDIVLTAKKIVSNFTPWQLLKYVQNELQINA